MALPPAGRLITFCFPRVQKGGFHSLDLMDFNQHLGFDRPVEVVCGDNLGEEVCGGSRGEVVCGGSRSEVVCGGSRGEVVCGGS